MSDLVIYSIILLGSFPFAVIAMRFIFQKPTVVLFVKWITETYNSIPKKSTAKKTVKLDLGKGFNDTDFESF